MWYVDLPGFPLYRYLYLHRGPAYYNMKKLLGAQINVLPGALCKKVPPFCHLPRGSRFYVTLDTLEHDPISRQQAQRTEGTVVVIRFCFLFSCSKAKY